MNRKKKIIIGFITIIVILFCVVILIYVGSLKDKKIKVSTLEENNSNIDEIIENIVEENKETVNDILEENVVIEDNIEEIESNTASREEKIDTKEVNINANNNNKQTVNEQIETKNIQSNTNKEETAIAETMKEEIQTTTNVEAEENQEAIKETDNSTKQETTQNSSQIQRCTNNNNHAIEVGNSNKWYNTEQEAIADYKALLKKWGDEWTSNKITKEIYYQKCPSGYETWSCFYCQKWTINYYYN